MKKYLLVVFGQFTDEMSQELALTISPVVDSPHLKFQFTPGAIVLHFASEVEQMEIHDFLCGVFYGLASTFILSELTDKVSVNMPKKYSDHLFDLENNDEPSTIRLKSNTNLSENDIEHNNNGWKYFNGQYDRFIENTKNNLESKKIELYLNNL